MIPDFTNEGVLPPGVHRATLRETREKLGFSRRRRDLISGLERALRMMNHCGVERVYIDGSFVTEKPRPGDIDGCYDVERSTELQAMCPIWPPTPANRGLSKAQFGVELFPADTIEGGSGQPFLRFFQSDRQGGPKGVVLIELAGEIQ
jgi:hypothetical protein